MEIFPVNDLLKRLKALNPMKSRKNAIFFTVILM